MMPILPDAARALEANAGLVHSVKPNAIPVMAASRMKRLRLYPFISNRFGSEAFSIYGRILKCHDLIKG
jgi:hypothetical protein